MTSKWATRLGLSTNQFTVFRKETSINKKYQRYTPGQTNIAGWKHLCLYGIYSQRCGLLNCYDLLVYPRESGWKEHTDSLVHCHSWWMVWPAMFPSQDICVATFDFKGGEVFQLFQGGKPNFGRDQAELNVKAEVFTATPNCWGYERWCSENEWDWTT